MNDSCTFMALSFTRSSSESWCHTNSRIRSDLGRSRHCAGFAAPACSAAARIRFVVVGGLADGGRPRRQFDARRTCPGISACNSLSNSRRRDVGFLRHHPSSNTRLLDRLVVAQIVRHVGVDVLDRFGRVVRSSAPLPAAIESIARSCGAKYSPMPKPTARLSTALNRLGAAPPGAPRRSSRCA